MKPMPSTARRGRTVALVAAVTGVAVLAAAVGAVAADRFSDVSASHAFHDEIGWLADSGISGGFPDGTFRPSNPVSRQAMAAFMQRVAGHDPEVAPMVEAATLGGKSADDFATADDVAALADEVAELRGDTDTVTGDLSTLTTQVDDLEDDHIALAAEVAALPDVTMAAQSGPPQALTSSPARVGPTVTITTTPGQKVLITASQAFGTTLSSGASGLSLFICRFSGDTATTLGQGVLGIAASQGNRHIETLSYVHSPSTAGTHTYGLCGSSINSADWNSNEYGYVTAVAAGGD